MFNQCWTSHVSMEKLTVGLLPRGPHALKDAGFPHGVELFDSVVLLVEVSIGLFPGLRHCVLSRRRKVWSQFTVKSKHRHKSHFIRVLTSFQRHLEWHIVVTWATFPPRSSDQFSTAQLERYAHYRRAFPPYHYRVGGAAWPHDIIETWHSVSL